MPKRKRPWTVAETQTLLRMRDIERAPWRKIALVINRTASACEAKHMSLRPAPLKPLAGVGGSKVAPTAIASRDAGKRLEHQSITASVFGDPLPGRSALDRRASS